MGRRTCFGNPVLLSNSGPFADTAPPLSARVLAAMIDPTLDVTLPVDCCPLPGAGGGNSPSPVLHNVYCPPTAGRRGRTLGAMVDPLRSLGM